ncbi:MAG TPA: chloride channel protein [Bacteroidota bacterium]|nr:chloride channel protein [Bacteroidota bacterium]
MNKPETIDTLADFSTDKRVVTLSAMAIVIGAMGAVVAAVLVWLINFITNVSFYGRFTAGSISPAGHHLGLWVILVPTIGGLIIGLMARYGSEKIRGHGIPEALEAILIGRSKIEAKVALLKPISSAISIGTGGPFGAEGPIIMTGGAFGSLFAQFFHLSAAERKTLLVAGAAAGMSAIFATPIAAVLLAVELLLFEWKPRSFIPVALAAAVAAMVRIPLLGAGPIFPIVPHAALSTQMILYAGLVGLIAGVASGVLTNMVYGFEDLFTKLPFHWMWWPIIGGAMIGIGGYIDPRVLGVGYDIIRDLLRGDIVGPALIGLLIGKSLVWSIALGSGTSGGVLAPLLMMGGALGAIEAHWIPVGDPALWTLISMAAMMGGTMRSPFTAMVFALELTHDLNVLPGLLVGVIAAEIVTVLALRRSILTEKVARKGHHIFREYSVDPFQLVRVDEVMDLDVPTVPETMKLTELVKQITIPASPLSRHQALPILSADGKLKGIITRGDLLRSMSEIAEDGATVLEAGTSALIVAYPDELLYDVVSRMLQKDIGQILVVERTDPTKLLGYLGRRAIIQTRLRRINEEHKRETGFVWGTQVTT